MILLLHTHTHTHTHTHILYIYIYIEREREREIVDFSESDKMIKISRKVDKSSSNILFFIQGRIKNEILLLNPL